LANDITCPICGSETTLRTVKKGPDIGRQFYVCDRFPECKGRLDYRIQNKIIELDKLRDQHEQDTQTARAELERYKVDQETIIKNEKAELERYKVDQETIIKNEKAELERYKAEQETIIENEKAEFERYKADQETIIKNENAELERYKALQEWMIKNDRVIQEQTIQIENRRAKDRLQQIDSQLNLKEEINKPKVIGNNEKCVVHQSRNAVAICTTCGNGVCDICRTGLGDKTYCPSCFNKSINS